MNINLTFRNEEQERFFWHRERNGLFDGGFGNGKSYVGCERAFAHLITFGCYGIVIARQTYKVLKSTTMKTFFKVCPNELIHTHDKNDGYTVLINRSFIYWMHLDDCDEQDLRGLEINSVLIDQCEEIGESIYLIMDARVGRWDKAIVPFWLLRQRIEEPDMETLLKLEREEPLKVEKFVQQNTKWPRHEKWGHFLVPNYMDALCNPSEEDEFHWNYRFYNPLSLEKKPKHFYIHKASDRDLMDTQTYDQMLTRDKEWVDKYVYGKTGSPKAQIHVIHPLSIIDPESYLIEEWEKFLEKLLKYAALYRILDHADTGVTACGWEATLNRTHIFYREYYVEGSTISQHRTSLADLSGDEEYAGEFADPGIFGMDRQRVDKQVSGFWSVAKEYADTEQITDAPPIYWTPADNNELATRNRINELLNCSMKYQHPITRETPAPGIYFIKACVRYPNGCANMIVQTKQQRKKLVAEVNGKKIYSVERDENITDHAYDLVRYDISQHTDGKSESTKMPPRKSFAYYNAILKNRRNIEVMSDSQ